LTETETQGPAKGTAEEGEEEPYEWLWDRLQNKWVKVTPKNSQGRRCGRCGCSCPCACADCLHQCCS
jgi:hypothetical protein